MTDELTYFRSAFDLNVEGRTLVGVALPWDKPTKVRDLTGPYYMEAFARTSCDKTLRERPEPRPLFRQHAYAFDPTAAPFGVAHFERSDSALLFRAFVSRTRDGDEALELVKDEALKSASVGFRPMAAKRAIIAGARVDAYRTEIGLRELSLAPTGYGQYPESGVTAIRSVPDSMSFSDIRAAVQNAVASTVPDDDYCYIVDLSDEKAVYEHDGVLYAVAYDMDANGVVTLADKPVEVTTKTSYVPVDDAAAPAAEVESNRSEVIAPVAKATPRLDAWRRRNGHKVEPSA